MYEELLAIAKNSEDPLLNIIVTAAKKRTSCNYMRPKVTKGFAYFFNN